MTTAFTPPALRPEAAAPQTPRSRHTRAGSSAARRALAAAAGAAAALTVALMAGPAQPAAAAAAGSSLPCGDCGSSFDTLRTDIGVFIPPAQQPSFLTRVNRAADLIFLPPSPIQPQYCSASAILGSLVTDASGLAAAGLVTAGGLSAIRTDVTTLLGEVLAPTEPCLPPSPI